MAKKDLQQLQTIKERMIATGIPEDEVNALVDPLKNEFQRRVCGLVWEHTTTSIPDMKGKIPALTPVTGKDIVNDINGDNHVLIEGENLLALMAMQYTHIDEDGKGMIDVIYIDPPYNTGSVSFAYNDKFEKSEWLSMMDIRLKLARNLLKDDGVIFISIDDSYLYELKMLCDDVFGNSNFLGNIVWNKKRKGSFLSHNIVSLTEYILTYSKNNKLFPGLFGGYADPAESQPIIKRTNKVSTLHIPENLVKTKLKDGVYRAGIYGKKVNPVSLNNDIVVKNGYITNSFEISAPFTWSQSMFNSEIAKGAQPVINTVNMQIRVFRPVDKTKFKGFPSLINGVEIKGTNEDAYEDLEAILGTKKAFDYSKPRNMIKLLLNAATHDNKNAIVLDFFAGSGTTGHAVLDLNKEDGGHRQFILCTNNELGKEALKTAKKNGYPVGSSEYEDLGVCHAVTYPRMQNIFPDYPDNNLYYYRIDQGIVESSIDDVTIANMASRAVFYVAMKEKVFNAEQHDNYYLLYNNATDIVVATDPDMDMFDVEDEIVPTAFSRQHKKVYCSVYEPCMRNGIEYIPYPKEVLDVLKAAKKYIRREVA